MFRRQRLLLAATVALLALTAMVSQASALSISFESGGEISITSVGATTFDPLFGTCVLTLSGTLARGPIRAVAGAQIGSVTELRTSCGIMSTIDDLPWPIRFEELWEEPEADVLSFTINGFNWTTPVFGGCVGGSYLGDPELHLELLATEDPSAFTTGLAFGLDAYIQKVSSGVCYPNEVALQGEFTLSPSQTVAIEP